MFIRATSLVVALAATLLTGANAAPPTPIPGGANALTAVAGKTGQVVFNGVLRVQITELRDATPAEAADVQSPSAGAGQKLMFFSALLKNGKADTFTDLLTYTLADKDAIAVEVPSSVIKHANPSILQGAALRQSAVFAVDKDFVPVKIIVGCATCGSRSGFRPIRFTITSP
jgi:hypothetical protein